MGDHPSAGGEGQDAVLVRSEPMPKGLTVVRGHEFGGVGSQVDYHAMLQAYKTTGFQATNFGLAVDIVNEMVVLPSTASNAKFLFYYFCHFELLC